ncbi:MAG: TIM barrel protein [Candidatus Humimicrobiaceae bacterium]
MQTIKIGIHQHVFTSKLDRENLDILNLIKDIGYDAVDINVRNINLDEAKIIKKRANSLNLTLMGGGSLPKNMRILSDVKDERSDAIKYIKSLIDKVVEIGSDFYGGVIYAPCGLIIGRKVEKKEIDRALYALKMITLYAKKFGIRVGIEPANRYETYVLNTIEDTLNIIDKINEPNLGILYDTFHMNIEEKSFYNSIKIANKKIFHMHVNENDRGTPGSGHILWDEVFKALKEIEYNRVIAIESFVDETIDIAAAACIWRKFAESPEILATEGLEFLKSMVAKYKLLGEYN